MNGVWAGMGWKGEEMGRGGGGVMEMRRGGSSAESRESCDSGYSKRRIDPILLSSPFSKKIRQENKLYAPIVIGSTLSRLVYEVTAYAAQHMHNIQNYVRTVYGMFCTQYVVV